jgi:hypothetical protein
MLAFLGLQNLSNHAVCQLGVAVAFAARVASFALRVAVIVSARPKTKVVRVDALRIVARVHDNQSVRNRTFVKLIRMTMGAYRLLAWEKKNSVPIFVSVTKPKPTRACLFDALQKNIRWPKKPEMTQGAIATPLVIMLLAKLSSNGVFAAINAFDGSAWLVCHAPLYASTMEIASV